MLKQGCQTPARRRAAGDHWGCYISLQPAELPAVNAVKCTAHADQDCICLLVLFTQELMPESSCPPMSHAAQELPAGHAGGAAAQQSRLWATGRCAAAQQPPTADAALLHIVLYEHRLAGVTSTLDFGIAESPGASWLAVLKHSGPKHT